MSRPTKIYCDAKALLHNLNIVHSHAPNQKVMAIVKADAYGCRIENIVPILEGRVDAFGVASIEEALLIRHLGSDTPCVLLSGFFSTDEIPLIASQGFQCVIHSKEQMTALLATPLHKKIAVWIKIDTGMHRLGFLPQEIQDIISRLSECSWVEEEIGLMTHFSCTDEKGGGSRQLQLETFNAIPLPAGKFRKSFANSAAVLSMQASHADVIRPGIMLYGVSPFADKIGHDLGLIPVMRFVSKISAIHYFPPHSKIGYGGSWSSDKPTIIGVVPAGYADGYPRSIAVNTPTWVCQSMAPIVGIVSMDMITIDLTNCPGAKVGSDVELWGTSIPVEHIAKSAGTIAYELLSKITDRACMM